VTARSFRWPNQEKAHYEAIAVGLRELGSAVFAVGGGTEEAQ